MYSGLKRVVNTTLPKRLLSQRSMTAMYCIRKPADTTLLQAPLQEAAFENATTTASEERQIHFGQSDHVRIYGLDIKERLIAVGFQIHVEKCSNILPDSEIDYYGLNKTEILFVGYKQY